MGSPNLSNAPHTLRTWILAQLALPVLGVPLGFLFFGVDGLGDIAAALLMRLPYPHGTVKWALESSQGMLLKAPWLPLLALAGLFVGGLSGLAHRLAQPIAFVGYLGILALSTRFSIWPVVLFAGLLLATIPSHFHEGRFARLQAVFSHLVWLPGAFLWLPRSAAESVGLPRRGPVAAVFAAFSASFLLLAHAWVDCLAGYGAVRAAMERWPDHLLDPRIRVLAHSPPGVRADWHGVQVVGSHALVVGEADPRLLAFHLAGPRTRHPNPTLAKFPPRWGPERAAPLDADTDPATGLTWMLEGPRQLRELRWDGQGFQYRRSIQLPAPLSYAYVRRHKQRLILASVQTAGPMPRTVISGTLPHLNDLHAVQLHEKADGSPIPMPREVTWAPPLERLVLAPDFGSHLYLADLATGEAEPWMEVPTLDGKMFWSEELGRIVLAIPNRAELWLIEPATREITEIPTQPGVRAVAVDAGRGLLVTASVLTGQILVQDLHTGEICDRLGTVMPMVREMSLSPELGEGVLTTWVATYQFPYTCGRPAGVTP